jgi:hypothetical protein
MNNHRWGSELFKLLRGAALQNLDWRRNMFDTKIGTEAAPDENLVFPGAPRLQGSSSSKVSTPLDIDREPNAAVQAGVSIRGTVIKGKYATFEFTCNEDMIASAQAVLYHKDGKKQMAVSLISQKNMKSGERSGGLVVKFPPDTASVMLQVRNENTGRVSSYTVYP